MSASSKDASETSAPEERPFTNDGAIGNDDTSSTKQQHSHKHTNTTENKIPSSTNDETSSTNPPTSDSAAEEEIIDLDAPAPEWTYGSCNALLVMRYGVPHEVVSKVIAPDVAQFCSGLRLFVSTLRHVVHTTTDLCCSYDTSNEDLLLLKEMKELRKFGINGRAGNEAALTAIAEAPHITALDFDAASWVGVDALRHLKLLPELRALSLSHGTSELMAHIVTLPSITKLDLSHSAAGCVTGIASLSGTLTWLRLYGTSQSEEGLKAIGQLTKLQTLNFGHAPAFADSGMEHLQRLSALTFLDLSHNRTIDADALKLISTCFCELETLLLTGCHRVDGEGLEHLSQLQKLRRLSLFGCRNVDERGIAVAKGLNIADLDTKLCGYQGTRSAPSVPGADMNVSRSTHNFSQYNV